MRAIAWSTIAAAGLVVAYLALGGATYAPAKVADPCAQRDSRDPSGFQEVAEQVVLTALDDIACELGVTREEVVLGLASGESFESFARDHGVSEDRLEELARSALVRGIDEAERADELDSTVALVLRELAERLPVSALLDLLGEL
jgi:hypothetical protein